MTILEAVLVLTDKDSISMPKSDFIEDWCGYVLTGGTDWFRKEYLSDIEIREDLTTQSYILSYKVLSD